MKRLTDNEIKFIKMTGCTATVIQCNEWKRTIWKDEPSLQLIAETCMHFGIGAVYDKISAGIFWKELTDKICDSNEDAISLEDLAIYLLRTFCTPDELRNMLHDQASALKWLQDWKYFFGFRKMDAPYPYILAALDTEHYVLDPNSDEVYYNYIEDDTVYEEPFK